MTALEQPTPCTSTVVINLTLKTVSPALPEGDDFYGLSPGTNGTAATARRACVGLPDCSYRWVRHDGSPANGINYVPTGHSHLYSNPWSGT